MVLEFVKTQLQLQQRTLQRGVQPYTGPVDVLRRTINERGVLAVYTGLSTLVVGSFAKAAGVLHLKLVNHVSLAY